MFHATAFMFAAAIKRATENKLTPGVSSVGELDAVDVQRHSEVHRPPRVRFIQRVSTRTINKVSAMTAVVRVLGVKGAITVDVSAGLVCRTIESDVHI